MNQLNLVVHMIPVPGMSGRWRKVSTIHREVPKSLDIEASVHEGTAYIAYADPEGTREVVPITAQAPLLLKFSAEELPESELEARLSKSHNCIAEMRKTIYQVREELFNVIDKAKLTQEELFKINNLAALLYNAHQRANSI